jgi:single-strand DNA-binding protein
MKIGKENSMSTNVCVISGNLVRDPELSPVGDSKVCRFTLAVNDGYGEKQKTYFIDCEAWGKVAETISSYCTKGKKISVTGILVQNSWTDNKGNKRSKTFVKALIPPEFLFAMKESVKALSEGDRIYTKEFGPDYPGVITQVGKEQVKVTFDDGDNGIYRFEDVILLTVDEEAPF